MCMAICRDRYEGTRQKRALACIGMTLSLASMIAPRIGAMLLRFWGWRAMFVLQAALLGTTLLSQHASVS